MFMAILRSDEMKEMDDKSLKEKIRDLAQELRRERGAIASGSASKNAGRLREIRRTVARIKTALRQRGVKE